MTIDDFLKNEIYRYQCKTDVFVEFKGWAWDFCRREKMMTFYVLGGDLAEQTVKRPLRLVEEQIRRYSPVPTGQRWQSRELSRNSNQ